MRVPRACALLHAAAALLVLERAAALRLLELRVPAHVARGARAALACRWQLDADALYSVKWYKDGKEFFRYVPRDPEPRRSFPLPGVHVERSDPSGSSVTLAPAQAATGGRYRCEVSGERPLFPTVSEHADMAVVVLPTSGPTISGLRPRYAPGDRVLATCSAGAASPAARLAWYINGAPAPHAAVVEHARAHRGLEAAELSLDFRLAEEHFVNNGFKVKCLATLATLYWRSNEESAVRARTPAVDAPPPHADAGVPAPSATAGRTQPTNSAQSKITSVITTEIATAILAWCIKQVYVI